MDTTDASLRLAALQQATATIGNGATALIVDRAAAFYHFLTGGWISRETPTVETVDPLPLAGEPPIETGAAKAANEAIKRTRRTKAEMEALRATEAHVRGATDEAIEAMAQAAAATPAPAAEPPTMLDVKAAAMRVVERDGLGQEAAFAIVKSFGVTRISALEEKQFVAFIAACNAKLAL